MFLYSLFEKKPKYLYPKLDLLLKSLIIFFEESSYPKTIAVLKLLPKDLYFFKIINPKNFTNDILKVIEVNIKN